MSGRHASRKIWSVARLISSSLLGTSIVPLNPSSRARSGPAALVARRRCSGGKLGRAAPGIPAPACGPGRRRPACVAGRAADTLEAAGRGTRPHPPGRGEAPAFPCSCRPSPRRARRRWRPSRPPVGVVEVEHGQAAPRTETAGEGGLAASRRTHDDDALHAAGCDSEREGARMPGGTGCERLSRAVAYGRAVRTYDGRNSKNVLPPCRKPAAR
jgi:hypothetical protein